MEESLIKRPEKIKLTEINPSLTCYLCKGYLVDATTISECLHSFCRSCIIKFLQDNSYCPVCEVIINKAKPNLKLDKTLQDIVYKLVPELFLREMTRRKQFYQQYPQIAARVPPEERGEDTERTIFNPQDCISLSMEYISADSSPGAIKLLGCKNGSDPNDPTAAEEDQAMMKRYLQCPGMCRVEVLKKFVRNKYNVDTSLFHIDVLYKRVPLPDHYTLIDIAYIYSWKRNEPMKFFFRITDLNKVTERFDYFDSQKNPADLVVETPVKTPRNNGDRTGSTRKREKKNSRTNKQASPKKNLCDENKSEQNASDSNEAVDTSRVTPVESDCDKIGEAEKKNSENDVSEKNDSSEKVAENTSVDCKSGDEKIAVQERQAVGCTETGNVIIKTEKDDSDNEWSESVDNVANKPVEVKSEVSLPAGHLKTELPIEKDEIKKVVYTNITLNRTNNVEIITKIQKVSNKAGQAIGLNITKQTVKSNTPATKPTKKAPSSKKTPQTKSNANKSANKTSVAKKVNTPPKITPLAASANIDMRVVTTNDNPSSSVCTPIFTETQQKSEDNPHCSNEEDAEKLKFLGSIELCAKNIPSEPAEKPESDRIPIVPKRKSSSPVKNETAVKKPKMNKKPTTRIILSKPKPASPKSPSNPLQSKGLKSLIESCKIPSSLSITLKDSSEDSRLPSMIPPVKNYIEILKLPDEHGQSEKVGKDCSGAKLEFSMNMCDNDSEQKVDEDLAQIAKSLTERIPMSTTISEIIGTKPQFPIPMKKFIQPSPVPELSSKVLNVPKDNNKLNPRSAQTFQKIFEQSIKKPEDEDGSSSDKSGQNSALDLSNDNAGAATSSKRNLSEIASQLIKKTKLEQENAGSDGVKSDESTTPITVPKVPIPRLPNQRNLKPPQKNLKFEVAEPMKYQQTLSNLHSNALGMNYTISVGHNGSLNVNGITPLKPELDIRTAGIPPVSCSPSNLEAKSNSFASLKDVTSSPRPSPIPRNLSPAMGYNSPKHSPKSSPLIKHMYAPVPNLMMDPLRVNTFTQRVPSPRVNSFNKSPKSSPQLPSSSANLPSPSRHPVASPASSPKPSTSSPKPPPSSPKPAASSPKPPTSSPNPPASSPKVGPSPKMSPRGQATISEPPSSSKGSPKPSSSTDQNSSLTPNQIVEKYNIQSLAQLSASFNFNAGNFGTNPNNQMAAIQHAWFLKQFEMQNRQNWLNMNQGPLLQYEKYLQSLKNNHLMNNIKEN